MKELNRREFLRTSGAGAAGLWLSSGQPAFAQAPESRPPNIVFVLADDLGYGDLGCYGQEIIQTPNLDTMADEGMRFTQCYAGSTVCAPSRCCLMTGLHTGHAWIRGNKRVPLRPEDTTVAEILHQAGYATGLVGKWGLGNDGTTGVPTEQGFDEFFGFLDQGHAHTYYPEYLWRNETKVPLEGNVEIERNVAVEKEHYSHDLFAQEALDFVRRHQEHPFFLYLAYTIPHANNERGRDGMEVPDYGPYADQEWPEPQKGHAAMISRMDRDMGRLFDELKELGIDNDTIVFFTSDNGPHKEGGADPQFFDSAGPLRGYKRDLYEGGIRVPGIVRWPGRIPAGYVNDHIWSFWDFMPTAAELAGVSPPPDLDGLSIVPTLLQDQGQLEHEYLYWEFHERDFLQAVRMGNWKAVRSQKRDSVELFDLEKDLDESHDISSQHPDIVKRARRLFEEARTPSPHWKP